MGDIAIRQLNPGFPCKRRSVQRDQHLHVPSLSLEVDRLVIGRHSSLLERLGQSWLQKNAASATFNYKM